jgi:uncharacterized protein (DUF433 family)
MGVRARVVSNPYILSGTPVVDGTRVTAENIMAEVLAGTSAVDIFRAYPTLPLDGIQACVRWHEQGRPIVVQETLLHKTQTMPRPDVHDCRVLPSDYKDYGGSVVRWADEAAAYPDCSCGCKYWAPLWSAESLLNHQDSDYGVCLNAKAPRHGMLTFEHMAGFQCFEPDV